MKIILRLTLAVVLFSALAGAILAGVDRLTKERIARREQAAKLEALGAVLPPHDELQALGDFQANGRAATLFRGLDHGALAGYAALTSSSKGYGGRIDLVVGLNPDFTVRAIVTAAQNETPGLGSQVLLRSVQRTLGDVVRGRPAPAGLPPNRHLDQYHGQALAATPEAWRVKQDGGQIDAVTGATVSSRAAADAVAALALILREQQAAITVAPAIH